MGGGIKNGIVECYFCFPVHGNWTRGLQYPHFNSMFSGILKFHIQKGIGLPFSLAGGLKLNFKLLLPDLQRVPVE